MNADDARMDDNGRLIELKNMATEIETIAVAMSDEFLSTELDEYAKNEFVPRWLSIQELYEAMFPGCPNASKAAEWVLLHGLYPVTTEATRAGPFVNRLDCARQEVYDVLSPNLQMVFIGGYPYSNNAAFPDPDELIFLCSNGPPMEHYVRNAYECVSYSTIKREFFIAALNCRITNVKEATTFMVCQWFQSFAHNGTYILLKRPSEFYEYCDCVHRL